MEQKHESDSQSQEALTDWKGTEDPRHPYNWPVYKKRLHIGLVSFITLVVNLAATMFSPAASKLMIDFSITNTTLATLAVSIYLLGFALGPLVIAPISEVYGRLWVYHVCNPIFLALTVACASCKSLTPFIVCRFLAGCAGAAPIAIGGGTIADVAPVEERGAAMAAFGIGPILGPVLGPIIGGFVAADLGWRWTLWIIAIVGGFNTIMCFIFMRETYLPVLTARIAKQQEQSNIEPGQSKEAGNTKVSKELLHASMRPTRLLFLNPVVTALALHNGFVFGMIYLLFATFPIVFPGQYGFSTRISGLSYLGMGVGMIIGIALFGILSDKLSNKNKGADGPKPEGRLPVVIWFSPLIPAGFFMYGWTAEYDIHWIVPIIGTALIGCGCLFVMLPSQIYVIDAFGAEGAASALAALAVVRSILGCFLPLAGTQLYDKLGYGWGNSVLAFITMVFIPVPIVLYKYGGSLRERFHVEL